MLLVKTKLGPSKIEGIGLFADQFIKKGIIVQKFIPGFDILLEKQTVNKLPKFAREQFLKYAYKSKNNGKYVFCIDNARFLNHSDHPNLISDNLEEEIDIAVRDIKKGEELTVNYKDFDDDYFYKMKNI